MKNAVNKDFDTLVNEVKDSLTKGPKQIKVVKKTQGIVEAILKGILSMNLFPEFKFKEIKFRGVNTSMLKRSQINAVNIISYTSLAVEQIVKEFEEEKTGKDPGTIKKINSKIIELQKFHSSVYDDYKKIFTEQN